MAEDNAAKKNPDMKSKLRRREGELADYVFGKVQPQATPLEEAVLGALMLDKDALPIVLDILRPESFYTDAHQLIYKAILKLFEKSHPVDLLTVTEELKKSGDIDTIGGPFYLVELTSRIASSANIEFHARIVAQKHIQRELIKVSTQIIRDAYEDTTDVFTLLDDAEKGLFAVTQNNLSRQYESMGELTSKTLKILEELKDKEDGLTGVPTGFTALDRLTSGWQPSDLIIVAARPGMGKTSYVLALARNAAMDFNKGVALFSLEMSSTQLVQRLISMEAEIPGSKLRNGKLEEYEWQQLHSTIERLSEAPIFIDDTPGINIFELMAKCRRLKMQHNIQMIIIDYLQLMSGGMDSSKSTNREQEISSISRALKGMAKELGVPVIALSQLSRAVETRGGAKRPQLSDLRECLTADTRIALADGRLARIADLVGQAPELIAFDGYARKLTRGTADLVWSTGVRPVFELTLASGRKLKATAKHQLLSGSGWAMVQNLKIGDRLAIGQTLPEPSSPEQWPDQQLVLAAYLSAGGDYSPTQGLRCLTRSAASERAVADAAEGLGLTATLLNDSNDGARQWFLGENAGPWLNELSLLSLGNSLPESLFRLSNHQIALFLQHFWGTDGIFFTPPSGSNEAPRIAFPTNSRTMAEDLATLLLRFSIVAHIQTTAKAEQATAYTVEVVGMEDQRHFLAMIGTFGEKRQLANQLEAYWGNIPATGLDVSAGPDLFTRVARPLAGQGQPSAALPRQAVDALAAQEGLEALPNRDLYWDHILDISPAGEEEVFDLTVPGHHSFLANGIVSHNSGAIEQDADIVTFIYRPEYYQILEDESGQSLKGIAEIIIAKHRNGALDTVKLRFTDQYAKFGDLEEVNFDSFPTSDPFSTPFAASNVITRPSKMNDEEDIPF